MDAWPDSTARDEGPFAPDAEPVRFGDYELLEEIGRGGMGVVYRARQVSLNRIVAVKMVPFGSLAGEQVSQRFHLEAEAAAQLQHPNIVAIHDVGEAEGQPFFSMDYVEGRTLADWLRPGPLSPRRAAEYVRVAALAVQYAHERGILHRDLKPANILIDRADQPRITDFGLARRLSPNVENDEDANGKKNARRAGQAPAPGVSAATDLTLTGQALGSPHYMPPEQASAKRSEMTPRSDVYALGATLYHAITGRPPFGGDSLESFLAKLADEEPLPPRRIAASVPRDLETICQKCLAKEPPRRYATAQELADELGRFLRDEPILAKPAGCVEKAWRWCRRKPAFAAALGLALLLGGGGVAGLFIYLHRAEAAYAEDLSAASRAYAAGEAGRVRALLERHLPERQFLGRDRRGWEWRYFWQQCRGQEWQVVGQHSAAVSGLDFSPDGRLLASADIHGGLRLWDLAARGVLFATNAADGPITSLSFAPDGGRLAHTTTRGEICLWDTRDWSRVGTLAQPSVSHLCFSPDGKTLAAIGDEFWLWDVESAKPLRRLPATKGLTRPKAAAFAPDGHTLAVADASGVVTPWDWPTGTPARSWQAHPRLPDRSASIEALAFAPGGLLLATAGGDRSVRLFRLNPLRGPPPMSNHAATVTSLAFSPNGRTLASGSRDQTVKLWDVSTQRELASWHAHPGGCSQVRFAPDGGAFATAGLDGSVKLWRVETNTADSTVIPLPRAVRDAMVFAHPPILALTTDQSAFRVWSLTNFAELHAGQHMVPAYCSIKGAGNGRLLEAFEGKIQLRRVADGQVERIADGERFGSISLDLSRDGRKLAASSEAWIAVWDVVTRRQLRRWPSDGDEVPHVRVCPDGNGLVTVRKSDGLLTFLDLATGHATRQPGNLTGASVLGFSADGRLLAVAGQGPVIRVFNAERRRNAFSLDSGHGAATALAFAPDRRRLAAGMNDGEILLWDLRSRRPVGSLAGHRSMVYSLAFVDADTLVSTTRDEVRLWKAPSLERLSQELSLRTDGPP